MNDLAQRLANGEPAAFAELYDACADRLYRYLVATLTAHDIAADVLQESFVRLAKSRRRLASVDDPVAYLFAVARNEARRHIDQRRRNGRHTVADDMTQVPFHTQRELGEREIATEVAKAIERLPKSR